MWLAAMLVGQGINYQPPTVVPGGDLAKASLGGLSATLSLCFALGVTVLNLGMLPL